MDCPARRSATLPIHVARQTDACTFADGARFPPARREPERTGGAQIHTILPEVNLHRLGQPAWPPRQIELADPAAEVLHPIDSLKWFEGTQEDSRPDSDRLARHVQHERRSVSEIHVSVSSPKKR